MELQAIVVCSRLVGDDVVLVFRQLVLRLRAHCAATGLTGVLLFDGETIVQLLEGTPEGLQDSLARLQTDARQCETRVLASCLHRPQRLFSAWRAGYAEHDALGALITNCDGVEPEALVDRFLAVCSASDCL